jgi:hydroxyacylglutathione hydrolase
MIEVHQLPVLSDNFAYVLREPHSGLVASVDSPDAAAITAFLESRGWGLAFIFNTHHHRDHVGGNRELMERFGCRVFGSAKDVSRIPCIGMKLKGDDEFPFGRETVKVFAADGHTRGHIVYWLPESRALFVGDTIFSLGCGKLFEGTPREMWATLAALRALPDDTLVYGAHEYTLENAAWALTVEPGNPALQARVAEAERQRAENKPTVPTTLGQEKSCNPFLRPESAEIQRHVGAAGGELWEIFGAIRADKDAFDSR